MDTSQMDTIKARYSIFLPVKNGGYYISAAITSILAQESADFALIILENKSEDNTLSIIREYSDPRITVLEASNALGIYENWQRVHTLLQSGMISSEFSTIIGHDDTFYPAFLANIEKLIDAYPDASLYQTHFDLIDAEGNISRPCRPIPTRESAKDFFLARCWGIRDSFGTGYVFRSNDYIKVGGIPDLPWLLWSDDLLIIRLARLSYKICGGESGFAYRLHSKSTSGLISPNKFIALAKALKIYVNEIEGSHLEFLSHNHDKIAFGYMIARAVDILNLPFNLSMFGDEVSNIINQAASKSVQLLQGNKLQGLSGAGRLNQITSKLNKYHQTLQLFAKMIP